MSLNGIDVSWWQRGINLYAVPADFVIVQATENVNYTSPTFHLRPMQHSAQASYLESTTTSVVVMRKVKQITS